MGKKKRLFRQQKKKGGGEKKGETLKKLRGKTSRPGLKPSEGVPKARAAPRGKKKRSSLTRGSFEGPTRPKGGHQRRGV